MADIGRMLGGPGTWAGGPGAPQPEVEGWRGFVNRIISDPNLRVALAQTGLGLMRTPQFGQSGWDTASEALNRGIVTLEALREKDYARNIQQQDRGIAASERDRTAGLEERKQKVSEGNLGLYGQQVGANVKAQESRTGLLEEAAPGQRNLTAAQAEQARANADWLKRRTSGTGASGRLSTQQTMAEAFAAKLKELGFSDTDANVQGQVTAALLQKGYDPGELRATLIQKAKDNYANSIQGMQTPMTPEIAQRIEQEVDSLVSSGVSLTKEATGVSTLTQPSTTGAAPVTGAGPAKTGKRVTIPLPDGKNVSGTATPGIDGSWRVDTDDGQVYYFDKEGNQIRGK